MLTLHAYMWFGEGPTLTNNRRAVAFKVLGLPEGQRAWIANMRYRWQVLRATDSIQGEWSGRFSSAEEAMASLQQ